MSALIMHVYQMRSTDKQVVAETEKKLQTCMNALKEVSKVWLVAKMVHTLFESILGNKTLEERLQKAAGKRHRKAQPVNMKVKEEPSKRKFDEMDLGFSNGPAHQVSYERSRPQTPALTPNRDMNGVQMSAISPQLTRQQTNDLPSFLGSGHSRGNTRPTTPFNPALSYPGTPPDLILVTRNSPDISHSDLWHNFQPDQLFPAETNLGLPFSVSPLQSHTLVDPALSATSGAQQQHMLQSAQVNMQNGLLHSAGMTHNGDPNAWAGMDMGSIGNNEDTWSNSSKGQGPIVPTSLNVEDWYVSSYRTG
jgi:hypothetical protein